MMIKKQLSVLAGSVLLAAGANAAITAGDTAADISSSAVLVLLSDAGSYVFDTGLTADQLAAGQGFTVDVSASLADLGTIDSFALFGTLGGSGSFTDYNVGGAVNIGEGVVYARDGAGDLAGTANNVDSVAAIYNTYISNVSAGGFFANGSLGDFDTVAPQFGGIISLSSVTAQLFSQTGGAGGKGAAPILTSIDILAPDATVEGAYIDGTFANVTNAAAVPVPAAAWLFGSALLGLGVIRRKK